MFSMIIQDLRISPLRNFLTGFSMFFGIIAMIASVLMGTIGHGYVQDKNAQLTGKSPTYAITVANWDKTEAHAIDELNRKISRLSWVSLSLHYTVDVYGLGFGSSEEEARQAVLRGKRSRGVSVNVVSENYRGIYNWPMTYGQWLTSPEDVRGFSVVVNKKAAQYGYGRYVAFNDENSLDVVTARVVGVVNDGSDAPAVYIEASQAAFYIPYVYDGLAPSFMAHSDNYDVVGEDMRGLLSDMLFDTTGGKVESIVRVDNSVSYKDVIEYLQLAFAVLAALLLGVSVIGLLNVGLVAIEQRSHELLIRRALGASRINIAVLVVGSLVLLSIFVCAIAVSLSVVLLHFLPLLLEPDTPVSLPDFPVRAAWIAVLVSVGAAVVAGLIPAMKAARLEVALALR